VLISYRAILQTRKDLEEKDKQRQEEFKQYEMQKKFEEEQKMKGNSGNKKDVIFLDYLFINILEINNDGYRYDLLIY